MRFSTGTRTPVKKVWLISLPPSKVRMGSTAMPSLPMSMNSIVMPFCGRSSTLVRKMPNIQSEVVAFEVQIFEPLIT